MGFCDAESNRCETSARAALQGLETGDAPPSIRCEQPMTEAKHATRVGAMLPVSGSSEIPRR